MTNKYKKFNQDFFKSNGSIHWYDTEGILSLDDNRIVTFEIQTRGMSGNYVGYNVEIYNKLGGKIVTKFFYFRNHLTMIDRTNTESYCHVWDNRDTFEWYISRPKNTNEMCNVIFDWIEKFK